ncbi:MAG: peptide-binding protein [Candidatus Limnocylindrales bacterium]
MKNAPLDMVDLLRRATPSTRREFLRRATFVGLAIPALGALEAACSPASTGPAASGSGTQTGTAKRGGTFITLGHQTVNSLSPNDAGPTVFYVLIANIHEGLLWIDHNYKLQPRLAESYEASADGKTWTFKLRKNVKWQDGEAFTAADVQYNIDWIRDPKNASTGQPLFKDVTGVDTPDDHTVVVHLNVSSAPFAALAATQLLVPKHVHEKIGEKQYKQQPVGTGPYKLKDWKPAEFCTLEAYDGYWDGRPNIDLWRQNIVPEVASRAVALQSGQADSTTWPITPEDTLRLMNDPGFQTIRGPGTAVNHFPTNNSRPLFSDKRVRQAMMYAIDRDSLVKDLMRGLAVKATGNLSPAIGDFYEPKVTLYPHDPAKAKTLLAEAGWTPGADGILANAGTRFSFTCLVFTGDTVRRSEAEVVQRDLKAVGIEMNLRDTEPTTAIATARKGDYDMALWNWTYGGSGGDPDARTTLASDGANNFSHWKNAKADELLTQGVAEVDPVKRTKIYSALQKLFTEEVPFLFIMYWESDILFSKRIKGLPTSATNPYALFNEFQKLWIEG